MPEFKLNGKTYSGSTNYASAITYTEDDGSKTTVQDKISELNSNFGGLNFAQDAEGNWGYIPTGADSVIPFSKGYKEIGIIASTSTNNKFSVLIKDNKVHNSETNIYDATGDYLRVYKSGDNSFIKVLQDCKAYVLYTGTGAKAGEILQLAKDQLYQWNIQYTGIGVVIVL